MSSDGLDSPHPTKKARKNRIQNQVPIITNSTPSSPGVSGTSTIDKGKGKAKETNLENLDVRSGSQSPRRRSNESMTQNGNKKVDKLISERTKKSWETRRAKQNVNGAGEESMVDIEEEEENRAGPSTHSPTRHDDRLEIPIPTTDFLLSLHHYSSQFYMDNQLLFEPLKKGRHVPWGSKKRLLIMKDAQYNPNLSSVSKSKSNSASKSSKSRSTVSFSGAHENDNEEDEDELVDDNDDDESQIDELDELYVNQIKQEGLVDEFGELILSRSRQGNNGRRKERSKGKYKKRDMYKSIEGEGLMALGILLQEHIIKAIHSAGYTKSSAKSISPQSSASPSKSMDKNRRKVGKDRKKNTKRRKRSTTNDESEEREIESEEGQE